MVQEVIVNFGERGSLCGIFTPTSGKAFDEKLCIIFLNAGLIHKVGPNRIYKKLAGKYAESGFTTLRLDFSGLGDSGFSSEPESAASGKISEVRMAMQWLQEHKHIDRFILSGMCTGAEIAWKASLANPRVIGLCLIDGIYIDDDRIKGVGWQQSKIRYYKKYLFSPDRWLKLLSGKSKLLSGMNLSAGFRLVTAKLKKKRAKPEAAIDVSARLAPWEMLFERNVKIQLVFCEGSGAIDVYNLTLSKLLAHYRTNGMLQTAFVRDADHTFTPIWAQNHLSSLTTTWLKKEFER